MLLHKISQVREEIKKEKIQGKSIALVPTMGYLHEGHLSLIKKAKSENDLVLVSIFVNPTQFGPDEDFESYPRNIDEDYKKALENGADLVFNPSSEEMYPEEIKTFVNVSDVTDNLCGLSRPTHFRGVATVVSKLFNIVQADKAYFGQKDAQQIAVIKKMVKDLNFPIEIISCPIVREEDGLALSSRNFYLSDEQRQAALVLSKSLFLAKDLIENGERNTQVIIDSIAGKITSEPLCDIDYVKIVDPENIEDLKIIKDKALIALAVKIGQTRLIDNLLVEVK